MYSRLLLLLGIIITTSVSSNSAFATTAEDAVKGVITRAVGANHAASITVKIEPNKDTNPTYEYSVTKGKMQINATDPVAACRGFYDYIRKNNLGMVGWSKAELRIPQQWPNAEKTAVTSPFKLNQMYNAVSNGYSSPYWNWQRWEHEFDWLALHGYNMILNPVATEAISERVWLKMGLTQDEIDEFVCGPAHAPWHRMGCIANTDGPLPKDWNKGQVVLQHQMLKRMKELKIDSVFQGFAGFVPQAMKRLYPNEKYHWVHWNGGFTKKRAQVYIMPHSPLFKKIMKLYLTEWEKEFGKGKYYLVDTFNELRNLPTSEGQSFKEMMVEYGANMSELLASVNPDAVWALQGWIFYYQGNLWKPEIVEALLSKVPDDKMLIFDMMGVWKKYKGFYGKPWVYGMITNMGARTPYTGDFNRYIRGPQAVIDSDQKNNNVGNSNQSEGVETNEIIFELIADTGWQKNIKINEWLEKYLTNRYGSCPPKMLKTWMIIKDTQFRSQRWGSWLSWQKGRAGNSKRFSMKFMNAVKDFLALHADFENCQFYQDDAVEMASFVLAQKADEFLDAANNSLRTDDNDAFKKNLLQGLNFMLQADRLLESHSLNRLERWTDFAKTHSQDKKLQEYYEENAKRIVTSWGPPVNDYAARIWSGLLRDFYVPRMQAYFDAKTKGTPYNKNAWEEKWLQTPGISPIEPYKNPTAKAFKIVTDALVAQPIKGKPQKMGPIIGEWSPGTVSEKWQILEFPLDAEKLKILKGVKLTYTKGSHRLDIASVELVCDGSTVAKDTHKGETGNKHIRNKYMLKVSKNVNTNNGVVIKVKMRSLGGGNSYGIIEIICK